MNSGEVAATIVGKPFPDELQRCRRITLHAPISAAAHARALPAEPGPHGVDEHEIGDVEEAVSVVDQLALPGGVLLVCQSPRAERTEMQR